MDKKNKITYNITILLIILFKFFIISNMEIISFPCDPAVYTSAANHLTDSFGIQVSGYPAWLWLCHQFGFPQRLAIEGLWIFTSYVILISIYTKTYPWMQLCVFGLMVFLPQTFYLFNITLNEGFYICLTGLQISLVIKILLNIRSGKNILNCILCGFIIGLMKVTRNESIVLNFYLISLFLMTVIFIYKMNYAKKIGIAFLLIFFCSEIIPTAIKTYNYNKNHVWMLNAHQMPSHLKLLRDLASIDTHFDNPRFVPITNKARQLAYAVSPSLSQLKTAVESNENVFLKASNDSNLNGEIGAGWIWLIFNSASPQGKGISLEMRDRLYRSASYEIKEAFLNHKLDYKFSPHPMIGNCISNVIKYFPSGLCLAWDRLSYLYGSRNGGIDFFYSKPIDIPKEQQEDQNIICNIRGAILSNNIVNYSIRGWAISSDKNHPITDLQTTGKHDCTYTIPNNFRRSDIDKIFGQTDSAQMGYGFQQFHSNQPDFNNVKIKFLSNQEVLAEVLNPTDGKIYDLDSKYGKILVGIDQVNKKYSTKTYFMGKLISLFSNKKFWVLMIFIIITSFVCVLIFDQTSNRKLFLLTYLSIFNWIILNFGFYSLLGAVCWVPESRYLFNTSIYASILFIYCSTYIANLSFYKIKAKYVS